MVNKKKGFIGQHLERLEAEYRFTNRLKALAPKTFHALEYWHQQLLTKLGNLHRKAIAAGCEGEFWAEALKTFPGRYYKSWRFDRAVSVAHMQRIYKRLNVRLTVGDIRGETWYAGIPEPTPDEIREIEALDKGIPVEKAIDKDNADYVFVPFGERQGLDGNLHPVDEYGHFAPIENENDIYGDGTGVTLRDLEACQQEMERRRINDTRKRLGEDYRSWAMDYLYYNCGVPYHVSALMDDDDLHRSCLCGEDITKIRGTDNENV